MPHIKEIKVKIDPKKIETFSIFINKTSVSLA